MTAGWYAKSTTGATFTSRAVKWQDFEQAWGDETTEHQKQQWTLGDLYLFGESVFGERASQVIDVRRVRRKSIQNYAWVCRKFGGPRRSRRRERLSFSHHAAVAGLIDDPEHPSWTDLAFNLLAFADDEGLSVESLEEEVRVIRGTSGGPSDPLPYLRSALGDCKSAFELLEPGDCQDLVQTAVESLADAVEMLEEKEPA